MVHHFGEDKERRGRIRDPQGGRYPDQRPHLQAHPVPRFTSTDVLSIDVSYRSPYETGAEPMMVEVIDLPKGMSGPVWTSDHEGQQAVVHFDTLDPEGGHAVGVFEATLCRVASIGAEPDASGCRAISGTFETELMVE